MKWSFKWHISAEISSISCDINEVLFVIEISDNTMDRFSLHHFVLLYHLSLMYRYHVLPAIAAWVSTLYSIENQ